MPPRRSARSICASLPTARSRRRSSCANVAATGRRSACGRCPGREGGDVMTRVPSAGDLAADFLPHAAPFLLLDRIVAIDEQGGRFSKGLTVDDPLVGPAGVLSPILVVEAMAQAAGLVLMRREPDLRALGSAVLAAIDRCEVGAPARAGDVLIVEITITRRYAD